MNPAPQNAFPDFIDAVAVGGNSYDRATVTEILVPEGVTHLEEYHFRDCVECISISLPTTLKTLGRFAFCNCQKLRSINLPSALTSIQSNAFFNCLSLASIDIPPLVTEIESWTFNSCKNLSVVSLPLTLTNIDAFAFAGAEKLFFINIPLLSKVHPSAFSGCSTLESLVESVVGSQSVVDFLRVEWDCDRMNYAYYYNYEE